MRANAVLAAALAGWLAPSVRAETPDGQNCGEAMVVGKSDEGSPGNPEFQVEFAEHFEIFRGPDAEQRWHAMFDAHKASHGHHNVGLDAWVAVVNPESYDLDMTDLRNGMVRLQFYNADDRDRMSPLKTQDVAKSEITSRGFDLSPRKQSQGKLFSQELKAFLENILNPDAKRKECVLVS